MKVERIKGPSAIKRFDEIPIGMPFVFVNSFANALHIKVSSTGTIYQKSGSEEWCTFTPQSPSDLVRPVMSAQLIVEET
jgi:hypothetical protein